MKKEKIFPFMDYEFERFKKGLRGIQGELRRIQKGQLEMDFEEV
jgi:hypothetical protein